ncbi:ROK family transcriptional regulator [Actinocrinis sp.]|uniref:ROK family transcriptional regulator n=1 Tax=Actinocrinis sp. TaxID=1920516 RepID=UPI002D3A558B|nr:ROK family transcriptional regulator [Actinocrinis sp.]HZP52283.1 ROK family transcriptional regulator [Actinocrinis sp.]
MPPQSATPQPATPQTARAINDRAALALFAARGALTAGQLQEATGLARPTVTELLGRLGSAGLIEQIGEVGADRRGPNARLYALAGRRACVAGIDVRTDIVYLTVTDLAGRTVAERATPIPPGTPTPAALDTVTAVLAEAVRESQSGPLCSVSIGMPGLINPVTGRVRPVAAEAGWHAELAQAVRDRTGLDAAAVTLDNEVNLAGIAEHRVIGPQGIDSFGLLWLGPAGVGASLILDGVLRRGASGGAGELGFLAVPGAGPQIGPTDCTGGLYDLVSPAAVARLAESHGLVGAGRSSRASGPAAVAAASRAESVTAEPSSTEPSSAEPSSAEPSSAELSYSVAPADFEHAGFRTELAARIALGAAAFALVVDPGVVVLTGDLGRSGGTLLATAVEERMAAVCPVQTRIRTTAVPGNPILTGAVATALDRARAALWP